MTNHPAPRKEGREGRRKVDQGIRTSEVTWMYLGPIHWICIYHKIHHYYYYYYYEFFTSVFANELSLESVWQQISSGLQDSSQYSSLFKQCCSLDGLDSSSDFKLFHLLTKPFGNILRAPSPLVSPLFSSSITFCSQARS